MAKRAAVEWGVLSIAELLECGLSRGEVKSRAAAGHLHSKYRGIYAVGHPKLSLEGCFLAAVKACGETARLSHVAAAALYGFVEWAYRDIDVTVTGRGRRTHRGIRVHRATALEPTDLRIHQGIPITSPVRTIVDLAAVLKFHPLRRAVRQALSRRQVTLPELVAAKRRFEGRRGTRRLTKVVTTAVPTRSEFEDIVHDLLLSHFDPPDVNVPLIIEGKTVVPDFRWPQARLVVEADSRTWHDNPIARAEDAERRALLATFGDAVLSVSYRQAFVTPRQTVDRIELAGAPLATRVAS